MNTDRDGFTIRRAGFLPSLAAVTLLLALMALGCKKQPVSTTPDDAVLNTQVQSKLVTDQNLTGQTIHVSVAGGVVTLSGSVASDAVRTIADGDAAHVAGVKQVVDNLAVQAPAVATTPAALPPAPATYPAVAVASAKLKKTSPAVAAAPLPVTSAPAPIVRNTPTDVPAPVVVKKELPSAPAPPVVRYVTVPAGTAIPVTITETLSSATAKLGDKFSGVVSNDVMVGGAVALAQGTPVTGHVDEAQDAAHFKGSSLLTVSLSAIDRKGVHIEVSTDSFTKKGAGRGKNTAEKTGGGAVVGALIGGIFGGGKGAAIGAATGGGVGAASNAAKRGEQVEISSESVVRFRLLDPITVRVSEGLTSNSSSSLEPR
jgi:hypothetical protein